MLTLGDDVTEYRVLGPLEVRIGDHPVRLRRGRQESVLAALLLAPEHVVSLPHLIECVWEGAPPTTASKLVRNTVSELRQILSGESLITPVADGYRLDIPADSLDATVFVDHLTRAREHATERRSEEAVTEYREALALWRGTTLLGLHIPALQPEVTRLNELRLAALEECVELELAQGQHNRLTAELATWTTQHPLRERLAAQFVLALYRAKRQAEALNAYERTKRELADELGVAPGPELRELHQRILANDPTLSSAPPVTTPQRARCDLPADPGHVVGRGPEFHALTDLLSDNGSTPTTLVISAFDGMAGVGKTTFAVHAAHQLSQRYPDGQLFIDLQAYTPGQQPLSAGSALDRLLRALGLSGEQIPASLPERAAEWRARIANRRMVVVLDNASDTGQVRPLLPGTPSSLVLITSRRRLVGLDNASSLTIDPLPPDDACVLFTAVASDGRPAAEPDAVDDILRLCGYLPLAIRIAAARLRHRPSWTVRYLADRLRDQRHLLTELEAEDRSVAGTFALSYQALTADQRRLFGLLGLLPCQDIDRYGAAALAETTPRHAETLLEDLVDAHLLDQPTPGRYRFHDLVRAYAGAQADNADRTAAPDRLLDYYLRTASQAMDVAAPLEKHRRPEVPSSTTPGPDLSTYDDAVNWLETEYANLLDGVVHAAANDRHAHVITVSAILWRYFHIRDSHDDGCAVHTHALAAARATADRVAEAHILTYLGDNHWWLGEYEAALRTNELALRTAREVNDVNAESRALHGLGITHTRLGNGAAAIEYLGEALRIGRTTDDRSLTAFVLRALGEVHLRLGEVDQALVHLREALDVARTTNNRNMMGRALRGLGEVYLRLGEPGQAVGHLREALHHGRATHNRNVEARALHGLGQANLRFDRIDDALRDLEQAVVIARETRDHALETEALGTLGDALLAQHDPYGALDRYHQALTLAERVDDRYEQARAHRHIARVHDGLDEPSKSLPHWQQAVRLYRDLTIPEADEARAAVAWRL